MHLHTFSVVDPGDRNKRLCRDCGDPQVYRPPTGGQRFEFDDVVVDKSDLRHVLEDAVALLNLHGFSADDDEVVTRLYALLD